MTPSPPPASAVPPLLPGKSFARLLAASQVNGWSVAGFAGLCAVAAAFQQDWKNAGWALLAAAPGVVELLGRRRLRRHDARGLGWMIGAQFLLLAVIWLYAWLRWRNFDPVALWAELPEFARRQIDAEMIAGGLVPELDRPLFLRVLNALVCLLLALITLLYQGGLALFYATRSAAVRAACQPPLA